MKLSELGGEGITASSVVVAPTSKVHHSEWIEPSGKSTSCAPCLAARSANLMCVAMLAAVWPRMERIEAAAILKGCGASSRSASARGSAAGGVG